VAEEGATVLVRGGWYQEGIDFLGKGIVVSSFDAGGPDNPRAFPVITGTGERGWGHVVTFKDVQDANACLSGFVITGGYGHYAGGITFSNSHGTIRNCLIVGNRSDPIHGRGGAVYSLKSKPVFVNCTIAGNYGGSGAGVCSIDSEMVILNSILCDNLPDEILSDNDLAPLVLYSDIAGGYLGEGNVGVDPEFVLRGYWQHPQNPGMVVHPEDYYSVWTLGDYHLKVTSPCIDAGDPNSPYQGEPEPNGSRVNMGAYGGTTQATTSLVVAP